MPNYIIVRINKQEKKERKSKIGSLYIPEQLVFMTRNCQAGEIIRMGENVTKLLPGCRKGNILIFHHFVESDSKPYFIHEDEKFYYYTCPCTDTNMNLTYGYCHKDSIVMHPDYVLLQTDKAPSAEMTPDDYIEQAISRSPGGLFLFKNWVDSREDMELKMNKLKAECQELAKTGPELPHVKKAIEEKEYEIKQLSKRINKVRAVKKTLLYFNPKLSEGFGRALKLGDEIYIRTIGCQTTMEFQGVTYTIGRVNYIDALITSGDER